MLKKPLIVGSKGNMGRRYAAILRHLEVPFVGVDVGDSITGLDFDSVIIATPTPDHVHSIRAFGSGFPILCEKPISTDLDKALKLCDWADARQIPLRMVNQYEYLPVDETQVSSLTSYNYFRHGNDGLAWDCISLIALAEGRVILANESPVWQAQLNGHALSIADMDMAYVGMIRDWLRGHTRDTDYIREAHKKVAAYVEATYI
jgi:hypothetical protein